MQDGLTSLKPIPRDQSEAWGSGILRVADRALIDSERYHRIDASGPPSGNQSRERRSPHRRTCGGNESYSHQEGG